MIEYFYNSIILIGLTSLVVIFYYNKIFKNLLHLLSKLLTLQTYADEDLQEYIQIIEKHVKELGVRGIYYELKFLKKTITKKSLKSTEDKHLLTKKFNTKLINGHISIEVINNKGEKKVINQLILYVISLQITNTIHTHINSINESFAHIAKLQTYMMHDLKNILQFFQAMQYNVENIQSEEEEKRFINFLQNSTEPINHKVNKILALLKAKSPITQTYKQKEVQLKTLFLKYIEQYKLDATVDGDCLLFSNEEYLETIIENILGNIYDKMFHEKNLKIKIHITQEEDFCHILITDSGEIFKNPQRVFEPFYSTKSAGIGIGMYQVSTLVELLNGEITCANEDKIPTIKIKFYKNRLLA